MSDFDIRKAVRAVMDETDLTAPEEVAAKVVESIPANRLRSVLTFVLRDYVRLEFGRARMNGNAPAPASRSSKVTAIRDAAPVWLRERVSTADGWTMLGDCTYENLLYLVADRLQNAARSTAAAEKYQRLADLVAKHKVARVSDLPRKVLSADEWQAAA